MTVIAGVLSRDPNRPVDPSVCENLHRLVSRHPDDERTVFQDDHVYLVKVDIGAYGSPGFHVTDRGAASMLAGEPLFRTDDALGRPRAQDLELLHRGADEGDLGILETARGTFCAVHYQPDPQTLTLIVDKLGLRPLYFFCNEQVVIFSTALRILEELEEVPKTLDLRGVTESTVFGYPLADRTPYAQISLPRASEVVQVGASDLKRWQYWRWDRIPTSDEPEEQLIRNAYEEFSAAASCRRRQDQTAIAFLSGGLDSRCIVGVLREKQVRVHTVNLAPEGSLDRVLAARFAAQAGTDHEQFEPEPLPSKAFGYLRSWFEAWARNPRPPWVEHPDLIWGGHGGSTQVAYDVEQPVVDALRTGDLDAGVEEIIRSGGYYVVSKLLKASVRGSLQDIPRQGIKEELGALDCDDPARRAYLFYLLNEERRMMADLSEDIDLNRYEYHLLFFDFDFLRVITSIPVDLGLRHRFYHRWLECFPRAVREVPWQAYPGHEPCPIPMPEGLTTQWQSNWAPALALIERQEQMKKARDMLRSPSFPRTIIAKNRLRAATWIHRLGLRDVSHVILAAHTYFKYWGITRGKVSAVGE